MNQTQPLRKDKLDGWTLRDLTLTLKGLRGIVGTWCQESEPPSSLFASRTGLDDAGLGDLLSVSRPRLFPCTVELVRWIRCQRKDYRCVLLFLFHSGTTP